MPTWPIEEDEDLRLRVVGKAGPRRAVGSARFDRPEDDAATAARVLAHPCSRVDAACLHTTNSTLFGLSVQKRGPGRGDYLCALTILKGRSLVPNPQMLGGGRRRRTRHAARLTRFAAASCRTSITGPPPEGKWARY